MLKTGGCKSELFPTPGLDCVAKVPFSITRRHVESNKSCAAQIRQMKRRQRSIASWIMISILILPDQRKRSMGVDLGFETDLRIFLTPATFRKFGSYQT